MIYESGACEERNTFFCRWNVLFQKKSKQGRSIEHRRISSEQPLKRRGISRSDQDKSCGISKGNAFCGKNDLKCQGFLIPSFGWIFSEIAYYCCLGHTTMLDI